MKNNLKPNGIKTTVLPTAKASSYNAWMRHITKTQLPAYRWQIKHDGQA
jgi:hypothetical protein